MLRGIYKPPEERFNKWQRDLEDTFLELDWYDNLEYILSVVKET